MKKFSIKFIILILLFCISVSVSANSKLVLPSITKQEALKIAENYVKTNEGTHISELDFENGYTITYNKSEPYGFNVRYSRIINNIPYGTDNISVYISPDSGEVIDCLKNFSEIKTPIADTKLITNSEAKIKFIAAEGLELRYNKAISEKGIETYLTYTADNGFLINAETGNTIPMHYDLPTDGYFDVVSMAQKTSGYIDSYNTLLSTYEADSIVRSVEEFNISDDYSTISAEYLKCQDNSYIITLMYQSGTDFKSATINAQSGIPIEFSSSPYYSFTQSKPQTDKIDSFAAEYYSEFTENMTKHITTYDDYTVCLYERNINGIPYKSNGLYICFDNYGNLINMSFAWDNTEFNMPEELISKEKAYSFFFQKCGLETAYYKRDNDIITPVYQKASKGTGVIDAVSGKQLNYDGTTYYAKKEMNYLDLNTHYSSYATQKLSDCDIYVSSGMVYLEDYITQEEYLLLISELITGTKPVLNITGILTDSQREMLYTYMYSKGVLDKGETNYTGYITRTDAVKYFLRILGFKTVGDMSDIFIPHFSDSDAIPQELIGYVELARGMGIINGDGYNRFNPDDFITNGDSLIMMYNYLAER